jgi:hypothetical protein
MLSLGVYPDRVGESVGLLTFPPSSRPILILLRIFASPPQLFISAF